MKTEQLRIPPRPKETVPIVTDGSFVAVYRGFQLLPPQEALVLIIKTTFSIVPDGIAKLADDQPPPTGDIHYDGDLGQSLRYASDFAPFKPRADILLAGHAYPPTDRGRIANVQLGFGALRSSLAAIGDRTWQINGASDARPFDKIPLRYERAFGGPGFQDNPLGLGVVDGMVEQRLPNLERPDRLIKGPNDRPAPLCFAPIPANFAIRTRKLGTYGSDWLRERWPYFPRDFDWHYFNVAPLELQIPYPRGDEAFLLAGMHPSRRVVNCKLPGLLPRAFAQHTASAQHRFREIPLHLDTVFFDADEWTVSLVWRGILDLSHEMAPELAMIYVGTDRVGAATDAEVFRQRMIAGFPPPLPVTRRENREAAAAAKLNEKPPVPPAPVLERAAIVALLAAGRSLAGKNFTNSDMEGLDFSGKDLRGALFTAARLDGAKFDGADLRGAVLRASSAERASFRSADLRGAYLAEAKLEQADFTSAALDDANLAEINAVKARFDKATLLRVNFQDAILERCSFDDATAPEADFSGAVLHGATMCRAKLDDAQMYEVEGEACHFDDASLVRFRADEAKFAKSVFARANAMDSSFQSADLHEANFIDANLDSAVLSHADFSRAVCTRLSAKGARWRYTRLYRVQALRANLMEANFEGANLAEADLRGANLHAVETLKARLDGANLDQAIVTASKLQR